jgi:hypothetical protein
MNTAHPNGYYTHMANASTESRERVVVGGLFAVLAMLSTAAVILVAILLIVGDDTYAAAAGVLLGLLVLLASADTLMARHQAKRGIDENGLDGPLPVLAVDLHDPLSESEDEVEQTNVHGGPVG